MQRIVWLVLGVVVTLVACSVAVMTVAGVAGDLGPVEVLALGALAVLLAVAGHRLRARGRATARPLAA